MVVTVRWKLGGLNPTLLPGLQAEPRVVMVAAADGEESVLGPVTKPRN